MNSPHIFISLAQRFQFKELLWSSLLSNYFVSFFCCNVSSFLSSLSLTIPFSANFGGVFNLVLGISIFSILELVYYFCIQLFHDIGKPERVIPMIVTIQSTNKIN